MHELTHIGWGTAKVCRGVTDAKGCDDHFYILGNKPETVYGPGFAKLLAKVPFDKNKNFLAATNSDNFAFYAASKFMQKRWKQYPKYPSAWDPNKDLGQNWEAQKSEPGFPPERKNAAVPDAFDYNVDQKSPPADLKNGVYIPMESYPEWYQPVIKAARGDPVPDVTEPTGAPTYNGPANDDIVCETSDGSPEITDCYHAFGTLKMSGSMGVLHGKKDGTWWAGYVQSCALAIFYTEDWGDDCGMSLKDVNDYSTAILEKCAKGDKNVVGGHASIKLANCPGQVQIYHTTDGSPPQGGLQ
ncbi:uncharacterized protein BDZ99DRAFT_185146 [Mytilinidion resinicola]|uniref:Uncharacterized protein n=1 Tax=Mytilinidion resinicola TaxID=574789 RepID=A0A6A6Z2B7_9PEZI|nr:uncharacterized protein BDZ99DRAFT_185146 [Mytilinidion resinicola]KAF2814813.1 hypothetical protein BDZ99DRAFT_185146 [Mytilinidion resinicola]